MKRPAEPVQTVKLRRDAALAGLVERVPFAGFLGVRFDRRGDEVTAILPFREMLIGNPMIPALHGGVTSAFLEVTAQLDLAWALVRDDVDAVLQSGSAAPDLSGFRMPKTIDFTVDYLRPGLPRDGYARARIARSGRRYASVMVEAWQDRRDRPFAQATGHFLIRPADG